jgi:hypothetical protein
MLQPPEFSQVKPRSYEQIGHLHHPASRPSRGRVPQIQ